MTAENRRGGLSDLYQRLLEDGIESNEIGGQETNTVDKQETRRRVLDCSRM